MLKGSPQNAVNLLNFKNMQVMIGSLVRKVAKKGISEKGSSNIQGENQTSRIICIRAKGRKVKL